MRLKLDKEPGLPPIRSVIMTTDEIFMMVKTVYGYYTMLNLETGVLIEEEFTLVKELLQAVNQKYTIVRIIPADRIEITEMGYRHKFPRPPKPEPMPDPTPKPDPDPDPTPDPDPDPTPDPNPDQDPNPDPDNGENTDPGTGTEDEKTDTESGSEDPPTTETIPPEGNGATTGEEIVDKKE